MKWKFPQGGFLRLYLLLCEPPWSWGRERGVDSIKCGSYSHHSGLLKPNQFWSHLLLMVIPYSAKFSRRIIFADWPQTAKIKLAKCFVVYAWIRSILGPRNLFLRNVQYDKIANIMRLENCIPCLTDNYCCR